MKVFMQINTFLQVRIVRCFRIKVTGRRGRGCKRLLDVLEERRGYCKFKEEALDRPVWRNRCECLWARRKTSYGTNELITIFFNKPITGLDRS
jgi:hypothetical protein